LWRPWVCHINEIWVNLKEIEWWESFNSIFFLQTGLVFVFVCIFRYWVEQIQSN
jgi:hypothetical protein